MFCGQVDEDGWRRTAEYLLPFLIVLLLLLPFSIVATGAEVVAAAFIICLRLYFIVFD